MIWCIALEEEDIIELHEFLKEAMNSYSVVSQNKPLVKVTDELDSVLKRIEERRNRELFI